MQPILRKLALGAVVMGLSFAAHTADYVIDTKGSHAFIQFKIKHLGYSWLYGRFNTFSGRFSYDESNPSRSICGPVWKSSAATSPPVDSPKRRLSERNWPRRSRN